MRAKAKATLLCIIMCRVRICKSSSYISNRLPLSDEGLNRDLLVRFEESQGWRYQKRYLSTPETLFRVELPCP